MTEGNIAFVSQNVSSLMREYVEFHKDLFNIVVEPTAFTLGLVSQNLSEAVGKKNIRISKASIRTDVTD